MPSAQKLRNIKKTFVKQHSQYYCGLACLASIVRFHGGDITQEKLRENSGTTLHGASLLGLYQAAQKLGFHVGGYETDIDKLKEQTEPVILHIVKDKSQEHFVVCYGFNNDCFFIGDPAFGITQYTENELKSVWKSKALLKLSPGKNFITRDKDSKNKRDWIIQLVKPDYPVLGIAVFLGIIISAMGLATAVYSQKLIDQILPNHDTRTLVSGLIIFAIIIIARAIISYVRTIFLVQQSREMNIRLISGFFGKLLFLPKPFFDSTSTGDMIARMNDAGRIQKTVVYLSSHVLIDVLIVVISTGYIFTYSVSTGLLSLFSFPIFLLIAWYFNKKVITAQREMMQSYAATESKYIDTINGIKTIKTCNRELLFIKIVKSVYGFFMQKVLQLGKLGAKMNLWIAIGSALLITGIISHSTWLVIQEDLLTGQMMAIITLIASANASVINIIMANIQLQEAIVAFDRMYEFASAEPEYNIDDVIEKEDITDTQIEKLEVNNLNFRFPGKGLLLKEISFQVKHGEIITFLGGIGCGKSTLLAILQRFHAIESGTILVNGKDWNSFSTRTWRYHIAIVEQHVQLFNGTILENISMEEEPDVEKVVTFCQEYGFHDFIMDFQQGYTTIIYENSSNLSGGQRQLIALARAVYSHPQLLLLDEATAAMGEKTERFVIKLLNKLKKEMLIIFVTHRHQPAQYADRTYKIENGKIV
ncbi:MAG: peptidase domain-containing ABC transporter [Mariniphaga sp.]|nr:peptidase domain-containing ABC transporter [Mariniphaga sp.]